MSWHYSSYALLLTLTAVATFSVGLAVWLRRSSPAHTSFVLMLWAIAEWSLLTALEAAAIGTSNKIFLSKIQYFGIVSSPVLLLSFALEYTGRSRWLRSPGRALLWVVPAATWLLAATNERHLLIWQNFRPSPVAGSNILIYGHGPAFFVAAGYLYIAVLTATALLTHWLVTQPGSGWRQAAPWLVGILAPWVANVVYVIGQTPIPGIDFTPLAFAITGLTFAYRLHRNKLLDLGPIARDALVEQMADGVLVLDAQRRVVDLNTAARRLLGLSAHADALGHPASQVLKELPSLLAICERDDRSQAQVTVSLPDVRYLDLHMTPLKSDSGRLTGLLVVWRDVTDYRQAMDENASLYAEARRQAQQLELAGRESHEARRAAESANRAKSVFLANMSHELRTPLNAILGFSELMASDPALSDSHKESLGIINRSGEHLLRLINDVLDLSKIESGRLTMQPQVFELPRMFHDLGAMLKQRAQAKGLTLVVEADPNLPLRVYADESRIRQVLVNLLGNAIKFTASGQVTLRADAVQDTDGVRLRCSVQDTGPGISPDSLRMLFSPFVQVGAASEVSQGTGLGLVISRELARMMGGEVSATSDGVAGHGALFEFDVPLELASEIEAGARAPQRAPARLAPGEAPRRILVVEDSESSRQLLTRLLSGMGMAVRSANDGRQALEICQEWRPHMVWMDLRLPGMDGRETQRRIRARMQGQRPVIIASTAGVFEDQRAAALAEGFDDFVRKPVRRSDIIEKLTQYLGIRFTSPDEDEPPEHTAVAAQENALAPLPASWLDDMRRAAAQADAAQAAKLLEKVRPEHPALAAALSDLLDSYQYGAIVAALDAGQVATV